MEVALAASQVPTERDRPGVNDPANPGFAGRLVRARNLGLAAAEQARDWRSYRAALGAFSRELNDGHALAYAPRPQEAAIPAFEWPGFVAAWRGNQALVFHAEEDSPAPVGSRILSCDGLPMEQFFVRQAGPYFRRDEAGQWWSYAPRLFVIESSDPAKPRECRFRDPSGGTLDAALSWRPYGSETDDILSSASDGEPTTTGLHEPRERLFLIGLPNFQPGEIGLQRFETLFEELPRRRAELMAARAVVLDLRHNNGGSSAWPTRVAQLLWGEEAVSDAASIYLRDVSIWWRASEGNRAHVADGIVPALRDAGHGAAADTFETVAQGMSGAIRRGETYYVQETSEGPRETAPEPARSDLTAPVYVITPGRCASACLDAVDLFTRFPNVRLIGAPTSADSTYMEIRSVDLPSGHGKIVIPVKMWVGRPRGNGEFYRPHVEMTDLDWSTASFLDRIERELAGEGR